MRLLALLCEIVFRVEGWLDAQSFPPCEPCDLQESLLRSPRAIAASPDQLLVELEVGRLLEYSLQETLRIILPPRLHQRFRGEMHKPLVHPVAFEHP
jgi:hypothetical protein